MRSSVQHQHPVAAERRSTATSTSGRASASAPANTPLRRRRTDRAVRRATHMSPPPVASTSHAASIGSVVGVAQLTGARRRADRRRRTRATRSRATAGAAGSAVGAACDAQQQHRQIVRARRENGSVFEMRLAVVADAGVSQRLEALEPRGGVRIHEPSANARRAGSSWPIDVVEIRQPAFVQLEAAAGMNARRASPARATTLPTAAPRRRRPAATTRLPASRKLRAEGGEGRRRALVEALEQRRVIGEEGQRLVVERGEAVAEQRRARSVMIAATSSSRRDRAMEDRAAPHSRRQRHRHRIARRGRCSAGSAAASGLRSAATADGCCPSGGV